MRGFTLPSRTIRTLSFVTTLGVLTAGQASAQVDNFNDGNDTGWTRYDPIGPFTSPATFSFPNGNSYRIQAPAPPNGNFGPARAGSIRNDQTLSGFYIATDIGPWDDTPDQAFGVLARISDAGAGTTDGYAFSYSPHGPSIDLSKITNEATSGLGGTNGVSVPQLDPTHKYRLVFAGAGTTFKGKIYDLADPGTIINSISASDPTYASGKSGYVVAGTSSQVTTTPGDATFDNFIATIPGDANADGRVTVGDLGILATNFNLIDREWEQGDFNLDGSVTVGDLGILATNFGLSVPGAPAGLNEPTFKEAMAMPQFAALAGAVPEPASAALAFMGLAMVIRRRR